MTPEQCRIGRQMLGWNAQRHGHRAGLSSGAVRRFEKGLRCREETVRGLCAALEVAGVEFTDDASGVRLRGPAA